MESCTVLPPNISRILDISKLVPLPPNKLDILKLVPLPKVKLAFNKLEVLKLVPLPKLIVVPLNKSPILKLVPLPKLIVVPLNKLPKSKLEPFPDLEPEAFVLTDDDIEVVVDIYPFMIAIEVENKGKDKDPKSVILYYLNLLGFNLKDSYRLSWDDKYEELCKEQNIKQYEVMNCYVDYLYELQEYKKIYKDFFGVELHDFVSNTKRFYIIQD